VEHAVLISRNCFPAAGNRGFSLVEIAVVLVIIGLILAAVLQGRELIASAEYKAYKSQLGEYRNAFYTFRDRFNALPGDFADANSDLGLASANGNGNGDGVIENGPGCSGADDESCQAWQHLRAAGMLDGNPQDAGSAAAPRHPYGGEVAAVFTGSWANGEFGHKAGAENVPTEVARRLDRDFDDEQCDDGRVAGTDSGGTDCSGGDWPSDADRVDHIYAF
jgi:prepilin-type N-terminal cleavage/methylation domain-containing protein